MQCNLMESLLLLGAFTLAIQVSDAIECSMSSSKDKQQLITVENKRSGTITSPQYPNYFPENILCTWLIIAPKGNVVSLTFKSFDVGHLGSCYNKNEQESSYVYVREGKDEESRDIGRYCGNNVSSNIVTSGRYLWVKFKASGYRSTRFKASFKIVRESHAVLLVVVATLVSATLLCILFTAICLNKRRRRLDEDFAVTFSISEHQINEQSNQMNEQSNHINSHTDRVFLATPLATALAESRYFGPAGVYFREETAKPDASVENLEDADTAHAQTVSDVDNH